VNNGDLSAGLYVACHDDPFLDQSMSISTPSSAVAKRFNPGTALDRSGNGIIGARPHCVVEAKRFWGALPLTTKFKNARARNERANNSSANRRSNKQSIKQTTNKKYAHRGAI
jgi:hypothetical protein